MVRPGDTLGVEEEFHVVREETGQPEPASRRLLRGTDAEPELQRSMVETASDRRRASRSARSAGSDTPCTARAWSSAFSVSAQNGS